jgi:hypothetical protein
MIEKGNKISLGAKKTIREYLKAVKGFGFGLRGKF